jgi:hypothetical protein
MEGKASPGIICDHTPQIRDHKAQISAENPAPGAFIILLQGPNVPLHPPNRTSMGNCHEHS